MATRRTKAELERENAELRERIAKLEGRVDLLVKKLLEPVAALPPPMPIFMPCPHHPDSTPPGPMYPVRPGTPYPSPYFPGTPYPSPILPAAPTLPVSPWQPLNPWQPVNPIVPYWPNPPMMPEIICDVTSTTSASFAVH